MAGLSLGLGLGLSSALNKGAGIPPNALILRDGSALVLRDGSLYLLRTA